MESAPPAAPAAGGGQAPLPKDGPSESTGGPTRKEELMRFLLRHKRVSRDAEKAAQQAQPSSNYSAYKADFQGTILRIYVPKDLEGRPLKDVVRFQLGGDNGIGKALELGNSRSSFKGTRDKIKEGKNLMSVISLGEALSFLDRTTKDRGRAQAMKRFLQEDVLPKLEHTELAPWTGSVLPGPSPPGLDECLERLLGLADKLDLVLKVPEGASFLQALRATVAQRAESTITVLLLGPPGSGKSHLGNRLTCPGSSGTEGPFPVGTQRSVPPSSPLPVAVRWLEHPDPSALRVALRLRSADEYRAVLDSRGSIRLQAPYQARGDGQQSSQAASPSADLPAMPELLGGVFAFAEVEAIPGGPFGKMQYIASQLPLRLSEQQLLAVEALLFESPAVNLPPRHTLIEPMGVEDAWQAVGLQLLLRQADVLVPCLRGRGITPTSLRCFLWDGLFHMRYPPVVLIVPEYVAGGLDGEAPMDGTESKRAVLPDMDERAGYRRQLTACLKERRLLPQVDIQQRLRFSQHTENSLEVLPAGLWALGEHPCLQAQLLQRPRLALLWAASAYTLLVDAILQRMALQARRDADLSLPEASSEGLPSISSAEDEERAPIGEAYWADVVRHCGLSFEETFKGEVLQRLEEARTEVQDFVEAWVWDGLLDGAHLNGVANYVIGVCRQMFEDLGELGCALRLEAQKAALGLFLRESASCQPEDSMRFVAASQSALAGLWEEQRGRGLEAALGLDAGGGACATQLGALVREELRQAWALHNTPEVAVGQGEKLRSSSAGFAEEVGSRFFHNGPPQTLGELLRLWAEGALVVSLNAVAAQLLAPLRQRYRPVDERKRTLGELGKLGAQFQELADAFLKMRSQLLHGSPRPLAASRAGDSRKGRKLALPLPLPLPRASEDCSQPARKLQDVPPRLQPTIELEWVHGMSGEEAGRDTGRDATCPYAWVEFSASPLKSKVLRVGAWVDRSVSWYEHLCRHRLATGAELCPPTFFLSREPFSEAALATYQQFQAVAYPQEWDASQVSAGEVMVLAFLLVERRHIAELPPGFQLPPHTWPVVLPDNSHPVEYCEAAKIVAELNLNYGLNSYAMVPCRVAVHEFVGDVSRPVPSALVRALQFGQAILEAERTKAHRQLSDCLAKREFKTELINLALDDGFSTPEGRDAFRKFNKQYDTLLSPEGTLQGSLKDLVDPLLGKVKERLEQLLEGLQGVSCVGFAPSTFAPQRQLLAAPANYCPGQPPSLFTLNDIDSQAPFSFCRPGILNEVLVPPSCGEEEFLQQARVVQKLFFQHLRLCGRRCLWTAQFSVECTARKRSLLQGGTPWAHLLGKHHAGLGAAGSRSKGGTRSSSTPIEPASNQRTSWRETKRARPSAVGTAL